MSDKSKELTATLTLINEKLNFIGKVDGNSPVSIDYIPPLGDNLGYTSLELLLMSLSSCMGSAILTFLRRMNRTIVKCDINAKGYRREEHPTGFKKIVVEFAFVSPDLSREEVVKVLGLAEEKYCPVWSMIKGNCEVETQITISK